MNMKYISLCFLCALSSMVSAQETGRPASVPEVIPADMHPGIDPWDGAIEFPAGTDDVNVLAKCQGRITESGGVEDIYCNLFKRCRGLFMQTANRAEPYCPSVKSPADSVYFANAPEDRQYLNAIYRASRSVRVTPATIEGQHQGVVTVFSVLFSREEGEELITLFQNQLQLHDEAGLSYVAPQIYERERSGLRLCAMPNYEALRYTVRMDGTADVSVIPRTAVRQDCVDRSVAHEAFIPGQRNGQPITAAMDIVRRSTRPTRLFYPYPSQ